MVTTASTTVLSDCWTDDDKLGLADFRGILRDILTDGPTPITVGVFGDWGSGKTSLMRMLMADVTDAGHRAVWFDAWKFTDESLQRALIQRIIDELRGCEDQKSSNKLDDLELHLYQDTTRDQEGEITLDWRQALKGSLKLGVSMLPVVGGGLSEIVKQFDAKGAGGVDDLVKSLKREQVKLHRDRYRFLDEFQTTFTTALAPLTRRQKRLVIFIDDLDRCLPDDALRILETVKLYFDAEGCVFVVGMDCRVIEQAIRVRYRNNAADQFSCPITGADYLDKLIQVPFSLPPIAPEELKSYITDLCANPLAGMVDVCCAGLEPNPRKVKRAINAFSILWGVAEKKGNFDPELMMKLVVIQCRHNELFQKITHEPFVLQVLEDRIKQYDSLNDADDTQPLREHVTKINIPDEGKIANEAMVTHSESPRDDYTSYAENEAIRKLMKCGNGYFTDLLPTQLRKYVFLASATAAQIGEVSRNLWERLTSDDEALMRGACAEIAELSRTDQQRFRRRLLEVMNATGTPAKTRCLAGNALAGIGDHRFHDHEHCYLPAEDDFGFRIIPEGPFQMGNDMKDDPEGFENETPRHTVNLPTYYMARFPVTVAQFRAFIDVTEDLDDNKDCLRGASNHPVVRVSRSEANAYCAWLNELLHIIEQTSGRLFPEITSQSWVVSLPSEAEWEKAARGVDARKYPWGFEWDANRANFAQSGIKTTSAVGCFAGGSSPYGIEDMSGNVWEWTRSLDKNYPYVSDDGREKDTDDWSSFAVLRGGSWIIAGPRFLRAATRCGGGLGGDGDIGFRCVVRAAEP